jgi:diguanylate cyclase (GGDEF)-like protein/PAS domain S-box-containing protein
VVALTISVWSNFHFANSAKLAPYRKVGFGFLFGLGAIGVMLIPFQTQSGFLIDLRTTMIGISAFAGGPLAGAITASTAAVFRIWLGGGMSLGVGLTVIALAFIAGCIAYGLRNDQLPTNKGSLVLSLTLAISAIAPAIGLGIEGALKFQIWGPIVTLVFATTLMASFAMAGELRRRQAEERNHMYRRVIDSLPEALNVKDPQGRFIMANPATADLMHVGSVEELIGKTDLDFYPSDIAATFRRDEDKALNTARPVIEEQSLVHLDGTSAYLSTLKAPFTDARGRVVGLITHNRDITDKKRLEAALTQSDRRAAEALSSISDGLVMFDKDLTVVFCNERYRSMFAATADLRVPGTSAAAILYASIARGELSGIAQDDVTAWVEAALARLRQAGTVQFPLSDGRWIESRTRPTPEGSCFVICSDVTNSKRHELELETLNEKLSVLAETDSLTGLLNRRAFDAVMAEEVKRVARGESVLALLMIDLDYFKRFNDTYGHGAGDSCLKAVADCLRASARRPGDRAARYGGEEMALVLPGADEKTALVVANQFCARLRDLHIPHTGSDKNVVTASVGVACITGGSKNPEASRLIAQADEALYAAKRDGRDGVRVWELEKLKIVQSDGSLR